MLQEQGLVHGAGPVAHPEGWNAGTALLQELGALQDTGDMQMQHPLHKPAHKVLPPGPAGATSRIGDVLHHTIKPD